MASLHRFIFNIVIFFNNILIIIKFQLLLNAKIIGKNSEMIYLNITPKKTIPPPPGGTAILPEYIHYYGYYYQVIVQCLST
jgi:hypothetical protein